MPCVRSDIRIAVGCAVHCMRPSSCMASQTVCMHSPPVVMQSACCPLHAVPCTFCNAWHGCFIDFACWQMVSLLHLADITEQGVTFASPVDGSRMLLTPEHSIRIQNQLGELAENDLCCPTASCIAVLGTAVKPSACGALGTRPCSGSAMHMASLGWQASSPSST